MNGIGTMWNRYGRGYWLCAVTAVVVGAALLVGSVPATAKEATKVLLGIMSRDKLFGVDFRDKDRGLVVGDVGYMLETKDGGAHWAEYRHREIGKEPLFDVCLVGDKSGWIVGKKGLILHTKDGGLHWLKQNSGTDNDLMAVRFISENRGFIAGSYGVILQTSDGGATWKAYAINWEKDLKEVMEKNGLASPHLYDIAFPSEKEGWIVGENGVIVRTTDGGLTWSVVQGGILPPLFSVAFRNPSQGWAVGLNGYAVATQDGKTWKKIDLGTKENLFRIRMNKDFGFVVGEWGTIIVSQDGGKTWVGQTEEDRESVIGISLAEGKKEGILLGSKTIRRIELNGR